MGTYGMDSEATRAASFARAKEIGDKYRALYAGTKVRYEPPLHGRDENDQQWVPDPREPEGARFPAPTGMRWKGSQLVLAKYSTPKPCSVIAKYMRENIAACAAHGLSYWSDAPGTCVMYAVKAGSPIYHLVHIERGRSRSTCGGVTESYTVPDDAESVYALLAADAAAEPQSENDDEDTTAPEVKLTLDDLFEAEHPAA